MARNKFFRVAIIVAILIVLGTIPAMAVSPHDYVMVTNETFVNLRSGPGEDYSITGTYNKGTWLAVGGQSGSWFYVNGPDGRNGYVTSTFTSRGPQTPVVVGFINNPNPASFLNFRKEPSYDAKVLDIFYNGVPVTIISLTNGWYHVDANGTKGFLRNEFLKTQTMLASESVATIVTPNNTALNLRQGPGTEYSIVGQFSGGKYVMILMHGTTWSKVSVDGYVGFMDNNFLKLGIYHNGKPQSPGEGPVLDGYGVVANPKTTQLLNLREKPNTTSRVLGRYINGTRVTILTQGTEWCHVKVDKTQVEGYMMTKYLKLHNLSKTPLVSVDHPLRSFVNLRESMSMNAPVLKRVSHGKKVTVLSPGDDWYKVKFDGSVGYMVKYFLEN